MSEAERRRGPGEAANLGTPAAPRQAASVVLLRHGGRHGERALEVLLLKRTDRAKFMPGVWVFPGGAVDEADGDGEAGRRACALRELVEEAGVALPEAAELVPFARWITPELIATRFDAWFFLAQAPAHCRPRPDGIETVEAAWRAPRAALAAHDQGELLLAFPTVKQLQSLLSFAAAEDALAAHRGRDVEPIMPKVLRTSGGDRVVLPGDPDYPA